MTTLALVLLALAILGAVGRRQREQRRQRAMRDLRAALFPGIRGRIGKLLLVDDERPARCSHGATIVMSHLSLTDTRYGGQGQAGITSVLE
jgi:hypothetical protein